MSVDDFVKISETPLCKTTGSAMLVSSDTRHNPPSLFYRCYLQYVRLHPEKFPASVVHSLLRDTCNRTNCPFYSGEYAFVK